MRIRNKYYIWMSGVRQKQVPPYSWWCIEWIYVRRNRLKLRKAVRDVRI